MSVEDGGLAHEKPGGPDYGPALLPQRAALLAASRISYLACGWGDPVNLGRRLASWLEIVRVIKALDG